MIFSNHSSGCSTALFMQPTVGIITDDALPMSCVNILPTLLSSWIIHHYTNCCRDMDIRYTDEDDDDDNIMNVHIFSFASISANCGPILVTEIL